jgi:hypothetical protein
MKDDREIAQHFFAAYFHQDCLVDDVDWQAVVVRFGDSEPAEVVGRTRDALGRLIGLSEAELETLTFGPPLQSFYDPRPEGLSLRTWLIEILPLLAGGSRHVPDRETYAHARRNAASLGRAALAGILDPIVAVRQLRQLRFAVGAPEDDPDFLCFVAIDSETDALPAGQELELWSSDALRRLEPEIAEARRYAFEQGKEAFANVVRRFEEAG